MINTSNKEVDSSVW